MEVRLDPEGGNEVNARAALHVFNAPPPSASAEDDLTEDATDSDGSSLGERPQGRCNVGKYDLNDGFIDDDEIVYEEEDSRSHSLAAKSKKADTMPVEQAAAPVLQPVELGFFINRGEVTRFRPTKKQMSRRNRLAVDAAHQARLCGWGQLANENAAPENGEAKDKDVANRNATLAANSK